MSLITHFPETCPASAKLRTALALPTWSLPSCKRQSW